MKNIKRLIGIILLTTGFLSFKFEEPKLFEFSYPKRDNATITLKAENFRKFSKKWNGSDYFYYAGGKDGMACTILYHKLNDDEKVSLVESIKAKMGGPDISPTYPFSYFNNDSNLKKYKYVLKKYEQNVTTWGQSGDDFIFQQNDVFIGIKKIKQKNMYGYCMAGKDLFVKVHLQKGDCTPSDSTAMRQILSSLTKLK